MSDPDHTRLCTLAPPLTASPLTESHAARDLGTARPCALPPLRASWCVGPVSAPQLLSRLAQRSTTLRDSGNHTLPWPVPMPLCTRRVDPVSPRVFPRCSLRLEKTDSASPVDRHGPTRGRCKCCHPDRSATARFLRRRYEAEIPASDRFLVQIGPHHRPPTRPIRRLARQRPKLPRSHHRLRPSRPSLAPGHGPRRGGQSRDGEETVRCGREWAEGGRESGGMGEAEREVREEGKSKGGRGAQVKGHREPECGAIFHRVWWQI